MTDNNEIGFDIKDCRHQQGNKNKQCFKCEYYIECLIDGFEIIMQEILIKELFTISHEKNVLTEINITRPTNKKTLQINTEDYLKIIEDRIKKRTGRIKKQRKKH